MDNLVVDDIAIFVNTCKKNRKKAEAVLKTWGRNVSCLHFVTGEDTVELPGEINFRSEINRIVPEDARSKINVPILSVRFWLLLQYMWNEYGANKKWFIKMDDDSYLWVDRLVKVLSKYDHNEASYMGDNEAFQKNSLQPIRWMSTGPGVVLSQQCLRRAVQYIKTEEGKGIFLDSLNRNDDVYLGESLARINIAPTHLEGFYCLPEQEDREKAYERMEDLVSVHYVSPIKMRIIDIVTKSDSKSVYRVFDILNRYFLIIWNALRITIKGFRLGIYNNK